MMLLYLGSLIGIHIGVYGTKVVREVVIRLVTGIVILLCVLSRAVAIPRYLFQLDIIRYNINYNALEALSWYLLIFSGGTGVAVILYYVFKAHIHKLRSQSGLQLKTPRAD